MSWTDNQSIKVIKYLRDKYNTKTFIETGTYMGVNAELQSKNFNKVLTCELNDHNYKLSSKRLQNCSNVDIYHMKSDKFLRRVRSNKKTIIYLDAHFYDDKLPPKKGKFVVLEELKALKNKSDAIIIIHDFDNNLGHIVYDGISLDMRLIKSSLKEVNKNFCFYTNELASCDIVRPTKKSVKEAGLPHNSEVYHNLRYAWKEPRLTFRGILYCLPFKLNKKERDDLGLRKWN